MNTATIPGLKPQFPRKKSPTTRLIILGVLAIILLVPQLLVWGLIEARQDSYREAQRSICKPWGGEQMVAPPYLAVPFENREHESGGIAYFHADSARIQVDMTTETRYRSIYKATLYRATVTVRGKFVDLGKRVGSVHLYDWARANILTSVSDIVGLKSLMRIQLGDSVLELRPEVSSSYATVGNALIASSPVSPKGTIPFAYTYELNGSEGIRFYPGAGNTLVDLQAAYPHPSFNGAFLPDQREVGDSMTRASWQVLYVNRPTAQEFIVWKWGDREQHEALTSYEARELLHSDESEFGMSLMEVNNPYDMVERAIKYAMLFIVFTFLTFFFSDTFSEQETPIVGYLLVGLALLVFYTLLLSIAEYLAFGWAFLISSVAVGVMVSTYLYGFVRTWKPVLFCAGILALLYMFLYIVLQLESFPLLVGSVFLFVMLGVVMYLSQKMKW